MDASSSVHLDLQRDAMRSLLGTVRDLNAMDNNDLDGLLRHIVEVACRMTGARYGALAVETKDDPARLSHFATHGLTDDELQGIGSLPACSGLLGRLIRAPAGFRLNDLTEEPDALGFPEGHPIMRTFLTMPLRIGSVVFGNLYLTEKAGGIFDEQDELTVDALTVVAGSVIDVTRRRLEAKSLRETSDALRHINRALLNEEDPARVVPVVLAQARQLRQAEAAAVFIAPDQEGGRVTVVAADGASADELLEASRDQIARSLSKRKSVHWTHTESHPLPDHRPRHSSAVPVRLREGACAVLLVVGWVPATTVTSRYSEGVLESLGDQVGLVLDRVHASCTHDELLKVHDRERIARDLHDLVIQRIFAAGLTLQGVTRLEANPLVVDRVERTIEEMDATIRDLRATIFALTPAKTDMPLRDQIMELLDSYATSLNLAPTLRCERAIEERLDLDSRQMLLLVLREAMSNVARHSSSTAVEVDVSVDEEHLIATVTDNGVGVPDDVAESGLANVRMRAQELGGSMRLQSDSSCGTVLRWWVPVRQATED